MRQRKSTNMGDQSYLPCILSTKHSSYHKSKCDKKINSTQRFKVNIPTISSCAKLYSTMSIPDVSLKPNGAQYILHSCRLRVTTRPCNSRASFQSFGEFVKTIQSNLQANVLCKKLQYFISSLLQDEGNCQVWKHQSTCNLPLTLCTERIYITHT